MKPWMRPYLFSLGSLLGGLLLFSVISSALFTLNWIDATMYHLLNTLFGYVSFGASGVCFGAQIEKKALFQALFMGFLLTLLAVFLQKGGNWVHLFAHSGLWFGSAVLIRSLRKR